MQDEIVACSSVGFHKFCEGRVVSGSYSAIVIQIRGILKAGSFSQRRRSSLPSVHYNMNTVGSADRQRPCSQGSRCGWLVYYLLLLSLLQWNNSYYMVPLSEIVHTIHRIPYTVYRITASQHPDRWERGFEKPQRGKVSVAQLGQLLLYV